MKKTWLGTLLLVGLLALPSMALAQRARRRAAPVVAPVQFGVGVRDGRPGIFFRNPTNQELRCEWQARGRNSETRSGESVMVRGSPVMVSPRDPQNPDVVRGFARGPRDGELFAATARCFSGRTQVATQSIPAPASY